MVQNREIKFKSVKVTEGVYNILVQDKEHFKNNKWNNKRASLSNVILEYKHILNNNEYENGR